MTPDEIAADRAVIDAATDGPWWIEQTPDRQSAVVAGAWVTLDWGDPDAAFIAAARTGWPRALDALEAAQAEVEKARAEIKATNGALARGRASAAAVARVLNLCNEKPECAHGLDCHCDCLAVEDVRAAADTNRPIDEEEDTP